MKFLWLLCRMVMAGVPINAEFTRIEIKINGKEIKEKGPGKYFYQTILIEKRN